MQAQDARALPSAILQDDSRQGLAAQPSGAWHANKAFATGAESPRSQLGVPEQDLQSQGSGASSGGALQEGGGGDTRDAPDHMDGAESNLNAQHFTGPEGTHSWSASCSISLEPHVFILLPALLA